MVLVIIWWFRNCLPKSGKILRKEITLTKRSKNRPVNQNISPYSGRCISGSRSGICLNPGIPSYWGLAWNWVKKSEDCLLGKHGIQSHLSEIFLWASGYEDLAFFYPGGISLLINCWTFRIKPPRPVGGDCYILALPLFWYIQLSKKPRSLPIPLWRAELKISRSTAYFIFTVSWVIYEIYDSMRFVVIFST